MTDPWEWFIKMSGVGIFYKDACPYDTLYDVFKEQDYEIYTD